jgi:hypothetical protein
MELHPVETKRQESTGKANSRIGCRGLRKLYFGAQIDRVSAFRNTIAADGSLSPGKFPVTAAFG